MFSSYTSEDFLRTLQEFIAGDTLADQDRRREAGQFHFIPLRMETFYRQLEAAVNLLGRQASRPLFIDVGCGIGTKLLAAKLAHGILEVHGVEIEEKYLASASGLLGRWDAGWKLHHGDAIQFDYRPYDIIYFYRPLSDSAMEEKLERRIMATAKKGALVIANGASGLWSASSRFEPAWGSEIYRKLGRLK